MNNKTCNTVAKSHAIKDFNSWKKTKALREYDATVCRFSDMIYAILRNNGLGAIYIVSICNAVLSKVHEESSIFADIDPSKL